MKIAIASDHQGYYLKKDLIKYLKKKNYEVIDFGTNNVYLTDHPKYAFKVGETVVSGEVDFGILVCGTGIGMSIACNKVKGVRCAKVDNVKEAKLTRLHNDANVLAISGKIFKFQAKDIVDTFLNTNFSQKERYKNRINMIDTYEKSKKYEF